MQSMSFDRVQTNARDKDETFSTVERTEEELSPAKRELLEIIRTKLNKGIQLTDKEQEFLDSNYYLFTGGK